MGMENVGKKAKERIGKETGRARAESIHLDVAASQ